MARGIGQEWCEALYPPVDRDVVNLDATLTEEFFDTVADDDLAVFLTARWRLYAGTRATRATRVTRIDHEPWPLRPCAPAHLNR